MELAERLRQFIERESLLRPEDKLVVAVSGGPDSLCLLGLLRELGLWELHVAHLDHGLRPESAADAEFVQQTAEAWGLRATTGKVDLEPLMEAGHNLEEAARIARYRFLVGVAREQPADVVVTGHTASDQAETILMHLLRGAGPAGLGGMSPRQDLSTWEFLDLERPLTLVRPLLQLTREETEAYCRSQQLSPRVDATNWDRERLRSRLRHDVMPALREVQPALDEVLQRTGSIMRATAAYLAQSSEAAADRIIRRAGEQVLAIDVEGYRELPLILRWQVLRHGLAKLSGPGSETGFDVFAAAAEFITSGQAGRHSLVEDLELERAGAEVILRRPGSAVLFPNIPQLSEDRLVPVPGQVELDSRWCLTIREAGLTDDERQQIMAGQGPWESERREAADASAVGGELQLRGPRPGERFQPLGMRGSMPLADFLSNEGFDRLQRQRWPLLVAGENIVWVVGLRLGHEFRLRDDSEQILTLELEGP